MTLAIALTTRDWVIAVALATALLFIGWAFGLSADARDRGAVIPEKRLWYTVSTLNRFLGRLGWGGLKIYRRSLWWDVVFAALYGAGLSFVLFNTWGAQLERWHPSETLFLGASVSMLWAVLPAAAGALADMIEDVCLLGAFPRKVPPPPSRVPPGVRLGGLAVVAAVFTALKVILVGAAASAAIGGTVALAFPPKPHPWWAAGIAAVLWLAWLVSTAVTAYRDDHPGSPPAREEDGAEPCGPDPSSMVIKADESKGAAVEGPIPPKKRWRAWVVVFGRQG